MNITRSHETSDDLRTIVIDCNEISFDSLVRCLGALPGCVVEKASIDLLNDNASAKLIFRQQTFELYTPFSDYVIGWKDGDSSSDAFEELVSYLSQYKVRWWEKVL